MNVRNSAFAFCMVVSALVPSLCGAWNKPGHMVSGAIAYRVLQQSDPKTLARVISILRQHPAVTDLWAKRLESVPAADRDLALFMYAARWPDDVRGTRESVERWHFVNIPYVPPRQGAIETAPQAEVNIFTGIDENIERFTSPSSSPADRAKALCWLYHLVGDIHQPLHVVTLFSAEFPEGDRGGTRFYVRPQEGGRAVSLHQVWDGLVIGTERFATVKNTATRIQNQFPRSILPELTETSPERWAKEESLELAKRIAYRNGRLEGGVDEHHAPVLPDDYLTDNQAIAGRRMAAAGYRIASLLRELVRILPD